MIARYEAVLFDFDGVIADSEPLHHSCWAEVLAPLGVDVDWETYRKHGIGLADRELVQFFCTRADPPVPLEHGFAHYSRKQVLFQQRMLEAPPVSTEALDFIRSLCSYRLGLVTSCVRCEVEPVVRRLGILDCFGTAIYAEDVRHHKPAPDPYLEAAARLGVKRALVVEDSAAGVASGRAAGFDVVQIPEARLMPELVRQQLSR